VDLFYSHISNHLLLLLPPRDQITLNYDQVVDSWITGHIGVHHENPKEVLKFVPDTFPFMEEYSVI